MSPGHIFRLMAVHSHIQFAFPPPSPCPVRLPSHPRVPLPKHFTTPMGSSVFCHTVTQSPGVPEAPLYHAKLRTQIASPLASLNTLSVPPFNTI